MEKEIKKCQFCKNNFIIEVEDLDFYRKINVPFPTWCPTCRLIRRLTYRENRPFYKDICKKCGVDLISIFPKESKLTVYCSNCWWGDDWDASSYGSDYDFSKSFFKQFHELEKKIPREASNQKNSDNCQYSNRNIRCKNCTLTFNGLESINCYNCETPIFSRDSVDSSIIMNADHAYESISSSDVYNTKFIYYSNQCIDSAFLFNCLDCIECFGCINLRNKKYFIFNKQYSKEDYEREIKKWDLMDYSILEKAKKRFKEEYYKIPRRFSLINNSLNVEGDDISHTKNCKNCFSTRGGVENCKFIFTAGLLLKDSYDVIFGGDKSEFFYETSGGVASSRCYFTRTANNSKDIEYSDRIFNCSDLFGCINLKNKKYCILNKQYSKEEYFIMVEKIKQQMMDLPYVDKKNRIYKYGEFFPSELSLWSYNETLAHKHFSLTKDEAVYSGYNWQDDLERTYEITIKAEDLPNHILNVSDSIINETISCLHFKTSCNQQCTEVFRILPNELEFYKQIKLALPRLCPNCRDYERNEFVNKPLLYDRVCMCSGIKSSNKKYLNKSKHLHGENKCSNKFKTTIGKERSEIIYCKECYQEEFI